MIPISWFRTGASAEFSVTTIVSRHVVCLRTAFFDVYSIVASSLLLDDGVLSMGGNKPGAFPNKSIKEVDRRLPPDSETGKVSAVAVKEGHQHGHLVNVVIFWGSS